jgi:hypothetical protein
MYWVVDFTRLVPGPAMFRFACRSRLSISREQRHLARPSPDKHVTIAQHLISTSITYLYSVACNNYELLIRFIRRAAQGGPN